MLRNSLRFRIIAAFSLFCLITGITYTGFVLITLVSSEDAVFNRRVSLEIDEFLDRYTKDAQALLPSSAYINGYIGKNGLSDKQRLLIENRPDGIYEFADLDIHVGIAALPESGEKLYIFYDTSSLEIHDEKMVTTGSLMVVSILFFLLLALLFSASVSDRVIQPVIRLADIIKRAESSGSRTDFSKSFYHDEIGFLARTLERHIADMTQTIEAEKRFASDVSHELRTPVTTVKGAADVIRRNSRVPESVIQGPVARIDRAVRDMENLIETFLALSRIRGGLPENETFELHPVIEDIIDQNRYLSYNKKTEISLKGDPELTIVAAPILFKIVISNLVRNAFQYTQKGTITIETHPHEIQITDTGIGLFSSEIPMEKGFPAKSRSVGIGLSIVQRLCDLAGWQLQIQNLDQGGTSVCLHYGSRR